MSAETKSPDHKGAMPTNNQQKWAPETVISLLQDPPTSGTSSPVPFLHLIERLKTTKREGWRRFGITQGESISDHMYRMAIMTLLCPPALTARLDIPRCTQMALIHDMAESLVGDITPVDGVSKAEKSRREAATMDLLCDGLLGKVHGGVNGESLKLIWREYEDDLTEEAHFVHDVDKIELLLQMVEYERAGEGKIDLSEFTWVSERVKLPEMKAWTVEILAERTALWSSLEQSSASLPNISQLVRDGQDEYYGQS